jgi:hypothetical protein
MAVKFKRTSLYISAWLTIIILSLASCFFNSLLFDLPFHLKQELPFVARWVIWLAITPLVIKLANKVSYSENKLSRFLTYIFQFTCLSV